ncbi:MAG TPA: hypothetical protein VK638_26385 [Edaphobacter sp.]|nr:hypothetical protein [Edaphobacter sp.]
MDTDILQEFYDSEISFTISSFWDDGFYVAIGIDPHYNEDATVKTMDDIRSWLKEAAIRHYPESDLSIKYGNRKIVVMPSH